MPHLPKYVSHVGQITLQGRILGLMCTVNIIPGAAFAQHVLFSEEARGKQHPCQVDDSRTAAKLQILTRASRRGACSGITKQSSARKWVPAVYHDDKINAYCFPLFPSRISSIEQLLLARLRGPAPVLLVTALQRAAVQLTRRWRSPQGINR